MPDLQDRHWDQLKALAAAGAKGERLTPDDLRKKCNVSLATIYSDLELLASLRVVRNRAGVGWDAADRNAPQRFALDATTKAAIADDVVDNRIGFGQVVYLDTGSTCFYIARRIVDAERRDIRLVTPNPFALGVCLAADVPSEIVALGGTLRREAASLYGPVTQHAVRQFSFDLAIISVDFVHGDDDATIAAFSDAEVAQKQLAIAQAASVVVVADASKLNRSLGHVVAPLKPLSREKSVQIVVGGSDGQRPDRAAVARLQHALGREAVTVLD